MDGLGFDAVFVDVLAEFIGSVFGAGEDDGEFTGLLFDEVVDEEITLVLPTDKAKSLHDLFRRGDFRGDGDGDWIAQDGMGEFGDRL